VTLRAASSSRPDPSRAVTTGLDAGRTPPVEAGGADQRGVLRRAEPPFLARQDRAFGRPREVRPGGMPGEEARLVA